MLENLAVGKPIDNSNGVVGSAALVLELLINADTCNWATPFSCIDLQTQLHWGGKSSARPATINVCSSTAGTKSSSIPPC